MMWCMNCFALSVLPLPLSPEITQHCKRQVWVRPTWNELNAKKASRHMIWTCLVCKKGNAELATTCRKIVLTYRFQLWDHWPGCRVMLQRLGMLRARGQICAAASRLIYHEGHICERNENVTQTESECVGLVDQTDCIDWHEPNNGVTQDIQRVIDQKISDQTIHTGELFRGCRAQEAGKDSWQSKHRRRTYRSDASWS